MDDRDRIRMFEEREIAKHPNEPEPDKCPRCGGELTAGKGMVGETILYCEAGCGIVWEDGEDAIRRVI
jgi:hypothetical protein